MRVKFLLKIFLFFTFLFFCSEQTFAANPKKNKKQVIAKSVVKVVAHKKTAKSFKKPNIKKEEIFEEVKLQEINNLVSLQATKVNPIINFGLDGLPILENLQALDYLNPVDEVLKDQNGNKVFVTIDAELQNKARSMLKTYNIPWGAIVAIEPKTGKVKTLAGYSTKEKNGEEVVSRASYPAASLFKLITASAAIEQKGLTGDDTIFFRGGNYALEKYNYYPNDQLDRRKITFADALGRSINPAFARVALNNLSPSSLERYAQNFSFNKAIPFDASIETSQFLRPENDYDLARTSAGFGPVLISPLHAAMITAAIANNGVMMKPYFISKISDRQGIIKYQSQNIPIKVSILSSTAKELMQMMQTTTETGTARKHFVKLRNPFLINSSIAAKTGTLKGTNPQGMYTWFVAAVPANDPEIAIAALVIDSGGARVKAAFLGKEFLEYFFRNRDISFGKTLQTKQDQSTRAKS